MQTGLRTSKALRPCPMICARLKRYSGLHH
jgi:hypothetical protein